MEAIAARQITAILALLTILVAFAPGAPAPVLADVGTLGVMWQNTTGMNATLWSVRWSPDGSMVSATYFDNSTMVFNSSTGARVVRLGAHPIPAGRCDGEKKCTVPDHLPTRVSAWSPDGKYLATGGDNRLVEVYNVKDWSTAMVLYGHRGSVLCLDFSPDGKYIASGSGTDKVEMNNANDENSVRIWEMGSASLLRELTGPKDAVMEVKWSPDGTKLVSVSDDKGIRLYDTADWSFLGELKGHTLGTLCVDFSPDGTQLVTGSRDYTVRLWSVTNRTQTAKWPAPNCVRSVDFHPDGEMIAVSGVDETMLNIRNSTTGVVIGTFPESALTRSAVMSARWSPDGKYLAAGAGKEAVLRVYSFGARKFEPAPAIPAYVPRLAIFGTITLALTLTISWWALRHREGYRR